MKLLHLARKLQVGKNALRFVGGDGMGLGPHLGKMVRNRVALTKRRGDAPLLRLSAR